MKKKNSNKVFLAIVIILVIFVLSIISIFTLKSEDVEDYYILETRTNDIKDTILVDSHTLGWIRVQGTDIDTPIVTYTESLESDLNADYLWTSFQYEEGENRKVIYGHNIRNVSSNPDIANKEHFRFEQLLSFSYYDFAKENLYIQYSNGEDEALYKIYAVSFNDYSDEYGKSYKKSELDDYIKNTKNKSIYDYDVNVNKDDELISLITCTRYFGFYEKTQFKVDARKVRNNEKISKYSVETNSNYDIIK